MSQFAKLPRTYTEQISILESRGLVVRDHAFATACLMHSNYYRLSAYARPFLESVDPPQFIANTRFEDVWELYSFDRKLRRLVNEATKQVEISVRSRWAYEMGHACGPFSYEDAANFTAADKHGEAIQKLDEQITRSQEEFIHHFRSTYGLSRPPIWAACEVMSFGCLSRLFSLLRDQRIKRKVAATYKLPEKTLESLLHHLTYVRNLCAHHLRLWNRGFTITPALPISFPPHVVASVERASPASRRIYNTLVLLAYMCGVIDGTNQWRDRLIALIDAWPQGWSHKMGFPNGWQKRAVWTAPRMI